MLHCRKGNGLQAILLLFSLASCSSSSDSSGSGGSGGNNTGTSARSSGSGAGGSSTSSASGGASAGTSSPNSSGGAGAGGSSASGGKGGAGGSSAGGATSAPSGGSASSGTAGGNGGGGAKGGASSTSAASALGGSGGSDRDAGAVGGGGAGADGAAGNTGSSEPTTCPAGLSKPSDGKRTVTVGSASRTYFLHVPSKYDGSKPVPLVVDYHGKGGNGTDEANGNPYKSVIDPEGVLSAYPDGLNGDWNIGPCCNNADDVGFAKALIQDVAKVACVNLKRVYAVGFSLGGGMVHRLGCEAADVFAAVSPAASDLVKETVADCKPARPITEISFRGTNDSAVPYNGGVIVSFTGLGAQATFKKWAELDQCTGTPSAEDSNGCSTYSTCADGVQVTLCSKKNGGHEPGNASVSWPILKKFALP